MEQVLVNDVQGYSIHDGPGIRTTAFLKGCNLRCRWCQNPEGISPVKQVGFIANLCQGCGRCAKACTNSAIVTEPGKHRIDYSKCIACGKCVDDCYYGALVMYGKPMSSEQLVNALRKDEIFYDASGGGITISGGEPLTHPKFVAEVLQGVKKAGISTAIETAGCVSWNAFEEVKDFTDLFLFDIKILDSKLHEEYIGQPNTKILNNAARLVEEGANVLFRMPLVKGINDNHENIASTAEFLKRINNPRLQLMPYHRLGQSKYQALDMDYPCEEVEVMSGDEVEAVRAEFESLGINCDVSK
ncbi:MAG: glycyl-radical enzyme activating protein [Coriobacteriales bacterium]|jgi:pyruvate formate lyase activating enzyme